MFQPRHVCVGLIRLYQYAIGPALPRGCRFEPSCSAYAAEAYERHGVLGGSWLTLRRLARCQPWGGDGYDPVPQRLGLPKRLHGLTRSLPF